MLMISELESPDHGVTLKLEGKISGCWVEEMQRICQLVLHKGASVYLDLSEVTFADRSGAKALIELNQQGVAFFKCSTFLTEQLKAVRDEYAEQSELPSTSPGT